MALRAKAATATIPIVFVATADAVQVGLVSNLARPEGNLTGINAMGVELEAKRLGLLHDLLPQAMRFGILIDPRVPAFESRIAFAQAAATTIGRSLEVLIASTNREIDAAFARAVEQRVDGLMLVNAQFYLSRRIQIVTHTLRNTIPAIFFDRSFSDVGGLMSYAASYTELHRQAGLYVGRILKGEKPTSLPVVQPTKFEFIINRQTAGLLGVELPPTLLALADEVIE
jgi:putative ABC transport system substrate-binding protein